MTNGAGDTPAGHAEPPGRRYLIQVEEDTRRRLTRRRQCRAS